jgi:hypothetical protein
MYSSCMLLSISIIGITPLVHIPNLFLLLLHIYLGVEHISIFTGSVSTGAVQYIWRLQRDIAGTKGIYPSLLSHHLVFPTTSRHHASRFRIPCLTAHVFSIDLVQRKLHTCRGGVLPPGASGHVSAGELGSPSCRRKETRQVRSNRHRCRHKMHGLPPQRITRPVFCIPSGTGEHVYYGF